MFCEESLIFFPDRYPQGDWEPAGTAREDVQFVADDGTHLHGWYAAAERPRGHVLFAHGNAGNITHRAPLIELMRDVMRVSFFMFDYRGYGKSGGQPDEAGVLADARASQAWLAERADIQPREVVLMGRSLGAAVVVDLAAAEGARGLILESTFTSMPDVAAVHYPWLPVRAFMRTRLDSLSKIVRYQGPLLQSHGTDDEIVPYELGRRLFEAAPGPKQFVSIAGAQHNDPQSAEYYEALDQFFERI